MNKVSKVSRVSQGRKVSRESPDHRGQLDQRVSRESPDHRGRKAPQDREDNGGCGVKQVPQVSGETLVLRARLVRLDRRGNQEQRI